jgi:hypothetical protein
MSGEYRRMRRMSIEEVTSRLDHCRQIPAKKPFRASFLARCPAHDDRSPSLSINEKDDGRVLIHCHSGCGAQSVLDAIGLKWGAVMPEGGEYLTRSRRAPRETVDSLVIEIAEHDAAIGKRLSRNDKERYRQALKRESKRSDTIV